mgnify:FL=1
MQEKWLQWTIEIQAIAQAGLTYGRDAYDKERYARLREIAAEMVASQTELPVEKVRGLFCNETGYQTPKVDTRAAVFQKDRILLVQEANGTWSLPGGWCDVNRSVAENTVKETLEEAGLRVRAERLIAVQDRNRHNPPPYPYGVVKLFVLCTPLGGEFVPNIETTRRAFFTREALPAPLAEEKVTREQILLCFDAKNNPNWVTQFD